MRKKPAPFLLRLYRESEEDRIVLEGLEKYAAIKGDKTRLIKKILFEYFSGHPSPRPCSGADAGEGLKKGRTVLERREDEGRYPAFRLTGGGAHGGPEEAIPSEAGECPGGADSLAENLHVLSALLL